MPLNAQNPASPDHIPKTTLKMGSRVGVYRPKVSEKKQIGEHHHPVHLKILRKLKASVNIQFNSSTWKSCISRLGPRGGSSSSGQLREK